MLFELRTYDLRPGGANAYLELLRVRSLGVVTARLPLIGYWASETGQLNRIHHLWAYADLGERTTKRAELADDREWHEGFVAQAFPLVVGQRNSFLALLAGQVDRRVEQAIGERETVHPPQSPVAPLFADRLQRLSYFQWPAPSAGSVLARWRVTSGYRPGAAVCLRQWPGADVDDGEGVALEDEILRPLSFSPLQ